MNFKTIRLLQFIFSMGFLAGIVISLISLLSTSGHTFIITSTSTQIILAVYASGFVALCLGYINSHNTVLVKSKENGGPNVNNLKTAENMDVEHDNTDTDNSQIASQIDKILKSDSDKKVKIEKVLSLVCNGYNAGQGVLFRLVKEGEKSRLMLHSSYAYVSTKEHNEGFDLNDGLIGLAVKEDRDIEVNDIPKDSIKILSGLGKSAPGTIVIIPVKENEEMKGVVELSFFKPIDYKVKKIIQEQFHKIGSLV